MVDVFNVTGERKGEEKRGRSEEGVATGPALDVLGELLIKIRDQLPSSVEEACGKLVRLEGHSLGVDHCKEEEEKGGRRRQTLKQRKTR